jgi:aspartyl aminopeptidase
LEEMSKSDTDDEKLITGWEMLKGKEKKIEAYCRGYMDFLSKAKTEREAVRFISSKAADGIIMIENRDRSIALSKKGKAPMSSGLRIIAAHIDSPRLDLKARPLYEDTGIALMKTHYYGGIKKYQWLARPLALHGIVAKTDGRTVEITIGEEEDEPCFAIDDLLPHLSYKVHNDKRVADAFQGEKLNIIVGSIPDLKVKGGGVKKNILSLLKAKYGIVEEDFVSADIEIVPAGPAREVGLDRSMIGGYGQDDRICAWAAFAAINCNGKLPFTSIVILADREETGSDGNTGIKSHFLQEVIYGLSERFMEPLVPARALYKSRAVSADVNAAFDPDYPEVHEKANAAKMGMGVCMTKFTGSRGKSGTSEASAEYMGWVRGILNKRQIPWQTGELGKVDEGGGGTIARHLAAYGMDIVDMGPALLSMHSPFELASKADAYSTYLSYLAFLEEK